MTSIKIAVLSWLQDKLASYAMRRPWPPRLSLVVDKIQFRLDALRVGGAR